MPNRKLFVIVGISLRRDQMLQLRKRVRRGDRSKLIQVLIDLFLRNEIQAVYSPPVRKLG
jgi:hypothetical protein